MIRFLSADQGDLVCSTGITDGEDFCCRTAYQVAAALEKAGGFDPKDLMHSSSVDFANEYGFRSSYGAYERWNKGVEIYQRRLAKKAAKI